MRKMSTFKDRMEYIEKRIKCIIIGHAPQKGYNVSKGLMIIRCARCYKILSKEEYYLKK
jgi:hypothetical protein